MHLSFLPMPNYDLLNTEGAEKKNECRINSKILAQTRNDAQDT